MFSFSEQGRAGKEIIDNQQNADAQRDRCYATIHKMALSSGSEKIPGESPTRVESRAVAESLHKSLQRIFLPPKIALAALLGLFGGGDRTQHFSQCAVPFEALRQFLFVYRNGRRYFTLRDVPAFGHQRGARGGQHAVAQLHVPRAGHDGRVRVAAASAAPGGQHGARAAPQQPQDGRRHGRIRLRRDCDAKRLGCTLFRRSAH